MGLQHYNIITHIYCILRLVTKYSNIVLSIRQSSSLKWHNRRRNIETCRRVLIIKNLFYFIFVFYWCFEDMVTIRKRHGKESFKIKHLFIRSCTVRQIKLHKKFTIACKPSIIHNSGSVYLKAKI
jgi:hypothetical protein